MSAMEPPVPTLTTPRLRLRPWRDTDVAPLAAITADSEVVRYMFGAQPLDSAGAREAYERRLAHWRGDGFGFFAVELLSTGEFIGWTGLQRILFERDLEGQVEVGWMLGSRWWGNGYAPEGAAASLTWGFETLGLENVYAFCDPDNARSESVMLKLGMRAAGMAEDIRDGSPSKLYVMSCDRWAARGERAGRLG